MVESVVYGFTLGAILYLFSIGLSLTFGTMKIINFAHGMAYTLGVYFFITFLAYFQVRSVYQLFLLYYVWFQSLI